MRQNENFDKAIERLSLIRTKGVNGEKSFASLVMLFKEYCRRMALWSEVLSSREGWPMFDVAARINPAWEMDDDGLYSLLKEKEVSIFSPRSYEIMKWFIHWEIYKDEPEIQYYDLPAPYEPAIILFERGGGIHREGVHFEILSGRLPRILWEDHHREEPFVSLDAATLDQEDENYNKRHPQFGY